MVKGRTNNQRFLLWLALGTAVMAIAMASLLVFEIAQKRAIEKSRSIQTDSLTALTFQLEREFLRLREELTVSKALKSSPNMDSLRLRCDIFESRLTLLRDSPSVSLLIERDEYRIIMPKLDHLVSVLDHAMSGNFSEKESLKQILDQVLIELGGLGSDIQAVSMAANSEVTRLQEGQSDTMREQNSLIVGLTVAQLVLLVVASGSLVIRQKRIEAERIALEKLTSDLRDANFIAENANRGKSQFLANMSHELRTPFNGLIGMLGLLHSTSLTKQQQDYIHTAQSSANHLLTLLNDILDLSALETGNITMKPSATQILKLISEVNALMNPLATSKGIVFSIRYPDRPLPTVFADETRVKQIIFNLISNSIKFTEKGEVSMTVTDVSTYQNTLEIDFSIRDTGIGMDTSVLSKLFHRFYQVDDSSTRRFGGTGLGLEISQSLARMMDGEITVRSELGVGSTFTAKLRLPILKEILTPMDEGTRTESIEISEQQGGFIQGQKDTSIVDVHLTPPSGKDVSNTNKQMHVLVAEDHPINQKLISVLLARMGCTMKICENGQIAVEAVQKELFDLVLMDINMPVMDGLTAIRQIRKLQSLASKIPIVVLTADVMNESKNQAIEAGSDDFLSKPIQANKLSEIITKYSY